MVYIIEGPTFNHKKHANQIRKRNTDDGVQPPVDQEEIMDQLYDSFEVPRAAGQRRSSRKRKLINPIVIVPNKKSYTIILGE